MSKYKNLDGLIEWPLDECECGSNLYYKPHPELKTGHIYEGEEMICCDVDCTMISHVEFNEDGTSYSTSEEADK